MTYKQNITAILECYFAGFKEEIIDSACNRILEQEPCEDAISRQAAINLIRGCNSALKEPRIFDSHNSGTIFEHYITELPPVNPQEPKTGHWIYKQYGGYPECGDYHCSQCDEIDNRTPAYCPHCGCCMFEPKETETWNGIHGQITAPKGTFDRIFNDADDEDDI